MRGFWGYFGEDSGGISVEGQEAIVTDMDSVCEKASVHVDTSTHAAELSGQDRGKSEVEVSYLVPLPRVLMCILYCSCHVLSVFWYNC